jgi:general secretion pathway protein K
MTVLHRPQIHPTPRARSSRVNARGRKRGVALIMVLGTLTILSFMLSEFQDTMSAELGSSLATRDQLKAEYAAKSGINLARLLLAAEPTIRAQLSPLLGMLTGGKPPSQIAVWEYSDAVLGAFNDAEGSESFKNLSGLSLQNARNLGMDGAGFTLKIVDEDSKFNFNMAARPDTFSQQRAAEQILTLIAGPQYNEYFEQLDENGDLNDRQTVCSALIDYVDPNNDRNPCEPRNTNASQSGAEDSYYSLLDIPDKRKNAAFDSLQELHAVRGVTDDFWTTFIEPDPDRPQSRNVTVWGSGKININSANPQTMLAAACQLAVPETKLCADPIQQMTFLQTLKIMASFGSGIPLFSKPDDFLQILQGKGAKAPILKAMIPEFEPMKMRSDTEFTKGFTVESKTFSIYSTGYVRSGKLETKTRIHAVVDMRGAPPPGGAEMAAKFGQLRDAGMTELDPNQPDQNPFLFPSPGGSVIYYWVD